MTNNVKRSHSLSVPVCPLISAPANKPFPVTQTYVWNVNRIRDVTFGVHWEFFIELYGKIDCVGSPAATTCWTISQIDAQSLESLELDYLVIFVLDTGNKVSEL